MILFASSSSSVCTEEETCYWGGESTALKKVLVNTLMHEAHHILCHVQHSWALVVTKSNGVDTKQCLVLAGFAKGDVSTSAVLVWAAFGHEVRDDAAQIGNPCVNED